MHEESSGHIFWNCDKARETWEKTRLPLDIRGVNYGEFVDFLWHLVIFMQHVGKDMLELIATSTWCMWCNRNKSRLGSPRQSSEEMIYKAQTLLADFQVAHLRRLQPKTAEDSRWTPPSFPWYKVNTDATVFKNSKSVGIGVVVRNHEGSVLTALSKRLPLPLGPLKAEAKTMEEAISFATDIGI
uniref:RNase H type-1 domain-containing protein n=1 Tax=Quercus lobata TaxID=97700 RepID=A0A7N2L839_QUELO